jgi:fumarylacetoacetase
MPLNDFTLANLPFGIVRFPDGSVGAATRIGDNVLALDDVEPSEAFRQPSLNAFAAMGPDVWADTRGAIVEHLGKVELESLPTIDDVAEMLPFEVGDYVDFYSSKEHATNLGRILRPGTEPLLENWTRLPVGYHGRSASLAPSGTPVHRPVGLVRDADGTVTRQPSRMLDFELEVGFFVGVGNERNAPIAPDDVDRHVFGAVLVNDWSARDIQAFEYQPLGPMLGKSFLTTVSPWVVPMEALRPFLCDGPPQDPEPDEVLKAARPWGLDIELRAELVTGSGISTTITKTNFRHLYWTFAQQLAHLTSNGGVVRPGDLLASGTVSGPGEGEAGSMIEATWRGERPLRIGDEERGFLHDGDTIVLRGWAGDGEDRIGFGSAAGKVIG